jgi:hypothetical protein
MQKELEKIVEWVSFIFSLNKPDVYNHFVQPGDAYVQRFTPSGSICCLSVCVSILVKFVQYLVLISDLSSQRSAMYRFGGSVFWLIL